MIKYEREILVLGLKNNNLEKPKHKLARKQQAIDRMQKWLPDKYSFL